MQEDKPYLNPELKITDLTRELQTNRTYLSTFINRTYGMNFKAYINDCRLREMEALLAGSTYAGESMTGLAIRAGFGCYHRLSTSKKKKYYKFLKKSRFLFTLIDLFLAFTCGKPDENALL